jgi:Holliday junction resolvase RusA-like endonuclease
MKTGQTRTIIVDANKKAAPWKQEVAQTARSQYDGPLIEAPILLSCYFQFMRPKSHYRTGKNAHLLRDSAPVYHLQKPDVTKLVRGVEDALTGVIYRDDCLIGKQINEKGWGPMDCTILRIFPHPWDWEQAPRLTENADLVQQTLLQNAPELPF